MLENLKPNQVFFWFEQLSAIPRGSGNSAAASLWCAQVGRSLGLETLIDSIGNVLIRKPASRGFEQFPAVILQSHLDMVCAIAPGCGRDLSCQGVALRTDGSSVWADGSSLGADNGIGVAMMLALIASTDIPHPPLEALFTVDEETGMAGALNLDPSWITARRMINLDAEQENTIWAGCAGGNTSVVHLPFRKDTCGGACYRVTVSGLSGGHSGIDISKGRANGAILLGRTLRMLQKKWSLRLVDVSCDGAVNAIPAAACGTFITNAESDALDTEIQRIGRVFRREYRVTEPGLRLEASLLSVGVCPAAMDESSTARIICLLACAPNGVQEMSADMPDTPQTSLNLGCVRTQTDDVAFGFCIRSSVDTQAEMLNDRLSDLARCLGGSAECSAGHPAWEFRLNSPLRQTAQSVYQALFHTTPSIRITHGGAECGVFAAGIPDLDCISIGPDISEVHTAQEVLSVPSVAHTWTFLLALLKKLGPCET